MQQTHLTEPATIRATERVTDEVSRWVREAGKLLEVLQQLLAQGQVPCDAPAEMRASMQQLLPAVRQCRAGQPSPEMLTEWIRSLAATLTTPPSPEIH